MGTIQSQLNFNDIRHPEDQCHLWWKSKWQQVLWKGNSTIHLPVKETTPLIMKTLSINNIKREELAETKTVYDRRRYKNV